jgi:hypothetical protein
VGSRPGQNSGQAWSWADYVADLVAEHGTLTAVAWKLVEASDAEDVGSVERALRRLRRHEGEGGVWGARLLRRFGVPRAIEDRLRFMGLYHSPFSELPVAICEDQLRHWDHPPVSTSRARVWLFIGAANVALRRRDFERASSHFERCSQAEGAAAIEAALGRAYIESRVGTPAAVSERIDGAERILSRATVESDDRACFVARIADHRAFELNRRGEHAAALALYRSLPTSDEHPFASYRRDSGLAYGHLHTGAPDEARKYADSALRHAGDGGYARLRVMALLMRARITRDPSDVARAESIARRLGDDELLRRVERAAL